MKDESLFTLYCKSSVNRLFTGAAVMGFSTAGELCPAKDKWRHNSFPVTKFCALTQCLRVTIFYRKLLIQLTSESW